MNSTSVAVTSSTNPQSYGDTFTLTATVTPSPVGPQVTGSVEFFSDGVSIGSGPIEFGPGSTGIVPITVDNLRAGTRSITAAYSGDSNYSQSTSPVFDQTIDKIQPEPSLGVSPSSPSVYGQEVTINAQAYAPTVQGMVVPTGNVTFTADSANIGTGTLSQVGTYESAANLFISTLSAGVHSLNFSTTSDNNYTSTSLAPNAEVSYTVNKANTATTLSSSINPSASCQQVPFTATVLASTPGFGTPTGNVVFSADGSAFATVALSSGVAATNKTWSSSGSHSISAAYDGDSNFNTSTSSTLTQTVNGITNWTLTVSPVASDPTQSTEVAAGNVVVDLESGMSEVAGPAIDFSLSACSCTCGCGDDNSQTPKTPAQPPASTPSTQPTTAQPYQLSYAASTVNPTPLFNVALASDFCASVPSQIVAQLTFNGTAQPLVTYGTTGHSSGDVYNLPLQVGTALATSAFYDWAVQVWATVGTTVYSPSASGSTPVVANAGSAFGAGWNLGGAAYLLIASDRLAMVDGRTGKSRVFTGKPVTLPFTYTSPAHDKGTLVKNSAGTYTYTDKSTVQTNFDSNGIMTSQIEPHGKITTHTYSGGVLKKITLPDSAVATISYTGGVVSAIAMPGGRTLSMSFDASNNLTGIVDAAGGLHTIVYDGSNRLVNYKLGPLNTTCTYSATNGTLKSIDRGLGSLTTITAAAVQGLNAATAINVSAAAATVEDALGNITSYTLDSMGRLTQLVTADDNVQSWTLDAAGNPTVYVDQLGRVTTQTYDASEDLTQIEYPDGTFSTYQYDSTFHVVNQMQDALNHFTTMTHDATTGDLLTVKDALGYVTTFSWSNGLKQTTTDALGRVTTLNWNSTTRQELSMQDALGNLTSYGYDSAGNQNTVEDALGRVTTSVFDGNRRLISRTNALGGVATWNYDSAGNVTSSVDELGRVTSTVFDQRGLPVSVMEAVATSLQRTTTTIYDKATNVLYVTDPAGDITSYAYDSLNRRIARIDASGSSVQRTTTTNFDAVGNVLSTVDPRGTTTSYAYSVRNWMTQRVDAFGNALQRTTATSYDAVGNVYNVTDPNGTITSFGYDADYRQTLRVDAAGISGVQRTTTTNYDAVGNTVYVTNPIGAITSFAHDALNRQTKMIEASGSGVARTTTTNYDVVSNTVSVVNPRGFTTSYAYDALNRRINQYNAYGNALEQVSTMVFDAVSNMLSTSNGLNVITSYAYDALNRRTAQLDAYGAGIQRTSTTLYDVDDNVIAIIDPLGFATTIGYDALNRRVTVENPDDGVATTVYDLVDNVVNSIDQLGNNSTYVYDVLNRRTQSIDARGGIVTLAYDPNNNLLSLTDPVSNVTQWQYDALNRQVREIDPLSFMSTSAYDAVDRKTSVRDKNSQLINYSYDLLNRETIEAWFNSAGSQTTTLAYSYDPNNNMLTALTSSGSGTMGYSATNTMTFDALDRLSTMRDSFSTLQTISYDLANNKTALADSFGGLTTRTFDVLNRVTTMQYSGQSATLREDYAYSIRDQVTQQIRYSNLTGTTTVGLSSMVYDGVGRLTNLQHLNGSMSNIANYTNTYDLNSRITAEILNGGAATTYQYDSTDQLTNDSVVTYSYDLNGNRTMSGYTTGGANELVTDGTWNYNYDRNGNLIQKTNISTGEVFAYSFDVGNRMVGVTDTTSAGLQMMGTYSYDALNRRIEKDIAMGGTTTVTRFAYDDTRQIWTDMNGSNSLEIRYLRTDNLLELPARVSSGGTAVWMLADRMGTVRNVVDNTGTTLDTITYDGYGNIVSESTLADGGSYKFAGYRLDSESTFLRPDPTRIRYYNLSIGHWLSVDPMLFAAGDANLRRYVKNNPSNAVDASGLQGKPPKDDIFGREKARFVNLNELLFGGDKRLVRSGRTAAFIFMGTMEKWSLGKEGPSQSIRDRFRFSPCTKIYSTPVLWLKTLFPYLPHSVESDNDVEDAVNQAVKAWNDGDDVAIFGWSRGSFLALQVARDLKNRGVRVKYLGLIDPVSSYLRKYSTEIPVNVQNVGVIYKVVQVEGLGGMFSTQRVHRANPDLTEGKLFRSNQKHTEGPTQASFDALLGHAAECGLPERK